MHEHRNNKHEEIEGSSNKSFGIVFAVVFLIVATWPLFWGNELRIWATIASLAFLGTAFLFPNILSPLNTLWTKFGLLLHKIVTPLVMGLVFFVVVSPIAILMRIFAKRPLSLKYENIDSYWIRRDPSGPDAESFNNQF